MTEYTVVIPVHNNENTIEELVSRIDRVFDQLKSCYEIIAVDDSSYDRSRAVLNSLVKKYPMKLIGLKNNIGQHRAVLVGFRYAGAKRIITMDADLQHQPEDIPDMIGMLKENIQVVIGAYDRSQDSWWRQWGTNMVHQLLVVLFSKAPKLHITSFKLYQGPIIKVLMTYVNKQGYLAGWLLKHCNKDAIVNHPVNYTGRPDKRSSYNLFKLIKLVMVIIGQALFGSRPARPFEIDELITGEHLENGSSILKKS